MATSNPRLETSIRSILRPALSNDGFRGAGRTFYKESNGLIQLVNVQGSRYGGSFAINLATQPSSAPTTLGETPNPSRLTESECEFRRRLSANGDDQWWSYSTTQKSMDSAVREATLLYQDFGRKILETIGGTNSPLFSLMPAEMPEFRERLLGFASTRCRTALVLARLRHAEGRTDESRAFASDGLRHVGRAIAIRSELEELSG